MNKILKSFELQDELCDKIYNDKKIMFNDVRETALEISNFFFEYIDIPRLFIYDIQLTGSLTNYNWSSYSDFDLHIICDIENDEMKELIDSKRNIFKNSHSIQIKGFDLEPYIQDLNEVHVSLGTYSILKNKWLKTANKEEFEVDGKMIMRKVKMFKSYIEKCVKNNDEDGLTRVFEKIKKYRKSGLDKKGELSIENLVFKFLRRDGTIEHLMKEKNRIIDKKLTLK